MEVDINLYNIFNKHLAFCAVQYIRNIIKSVIKKSTSFTILFSYETDDNLIGI